MQGCYRDGSPISSRSKPRCKCGVQNPGEFHECKPKNPMVSEAQLWEHSDGERRLILKVTKNGVRYAEVSRERFMAGISYSVGYESADVWEYWAAKAKFLI
jgi:hypothetical protein